MLSLKLGDSSSFILSIIKSLFGSSSSSFCLFLTGMGSGMGSPPIHNICHHIETLCKDGCSVAICGVAHVQTSVCSLAFLLSLFKYIAGFSLLLFVQSLLWLSKVTSSDFLPISAFVNRSHPSIENICFQVRRGWDGVRDWGWAFEALFWAAEWVGAFRDHPVDQVAEKPRRIWVFTELVLGLWPQTLPRCYHHSRPQTELVWGQQANRRTVWSSQDCGQAQSSNNSCWEPLSLTGDGRGKSLIWIGMVLITLFIIYILQAHQSLAII